MKSGLYVTATPIGNLGDLTDRAKKVLESADLIACEDTRVTAKLLRHLGIKTSTCSYHEHNAATQRPKILDRVANGDVVALVSDAGTPLISDPGYKLVMEAAEMGLYVEPLPGPSAVVTALMVAGLPTDRFMFMGFLPTKEKARGDILDEVASINATLVFYESPNRVTKTLAQMVKLYGGERQAAVCRELTKMYEETVRGTLADVSDNFAARETIKGEIVIVVAPPMAKEKPTGEALDILILKALETMRVKDAAAHLSKELGLAKRDIYQRALKLSKGKE
jgi:16S rRNA (cytidine1402-2'-O)-methyltransferase